MILSLELCRLYFNYYYFNLLFLFFIKLILNKILFKFKVLIILMILDSTKTFNWYNKIIYIFFYFLSSLVLGSSLNIIRSEYFDPLYLLNR
jgi:hypothetical protein